MFKCWCILQIGFSTNYLGTNYTPILWCDNYQLPFFQRGANVLKRIILPSIPEKFVLSSYIYVTCRWTSCKGRRSYAFQTILYRARFGRVWANTRGGRPVSIDTDRAEPMWSFTGRFGPLLHNEFWTLFFRPAENAKMTHQWDHLK